VSRPPPIRRAAPRAPAKQPAVNDTVVVRALVLAAMLLWIVSLGLPGYYLVGSKSAPIGGLDALGLGLAFGWISWGTAAYANLPFAAAVVMLFLGRRATWLVAAMMLLLLTLLLYSVQPSGTGSVEGVRAWGLGAVLWVVSLTLAAVAGAVRACRDAGAERPSSIVLATVVLVATGAASLMGHSIAWPRPFELRFTGADQSAPTACAGGAAASAPGAACGSSPVP
jgi:hypothetical protein